MFASFLIFEKRENAPYFQISHRESIVLIYRTPLSRACFLRIGNSENEIEIQDSKKVATELKPKRGCRECFERKHVTFFTALLFAKLATFSWKRHWSIIIKQALTSLRLVRNMSPKFQRKETTFVLIRKVSNTWELRFEKNKLLQYNLLRRWK